MSGNIFSNDIIKTYELEEIKVEEPVIEEKIDYFDEMTETEKTIYENIKLENAKIINENSINKEKTRNLSKPKNSEAYGGFASALVITTLAAFVSGAVMTLLYFMGK